MTAEYILTQLHKRIKSKNEVIRLCGEKIFLLEATNKSLKESLAILVKQNDVLLEKIVGLQDDAEEQEAENMELEGQVDELNLIIDEHEHDLGQTIR